MSLISKIFGFITKTRRSEDITLEDMQTLLKTNYGVILLDVRSPQEYKEGHMINAINIPLYELWARVRSEIPNKETLIIAYCKSGRRSKEAVKILRKCGYQNSYNLNITTNFN